MIIHASETPRNLQAEIQQLCCFPHLKQQKQKQNYTQKQKGCKMKKRLSNDIALHDYKKIFQGSLK